MKNIAYTDIQKTIIQSPLERSLFVEGSAGSGKTTAAVARLESMLREIPGHQILIMVPQRSLGMPYQNFFRNNQSYKGSLPSILTLGGLSRRMISLFWPLAAQTAGFRQPNQPPYFLSLETAQYCMAKIVDPKREKGFFSAITINKNRIYSQIIDNLNKAAVVQFPITDIARRLKSDQNLAPEVPLALDQTQICALEFREYCLQNNLLDFSLQVETFITHIWPLKLCQDYFHTYFPNLICDNLEEDVPVTHDLIKEWLPRSKSALLILDRRGGYRTFLGADPSSAQSLSTLCQDRILSEDSFQPGQVMDNFKLAIDSCINHTPPGQPVPDYSSVLSLKDFHFYPEMLSGVVEEIARLVDSHQNQPGDLVILAPYLSDALKFSLTRLMDQKNIPYYSSRPSRTFLEEPAVKCMLTFAKLAHPHWEIRVSHFELRDALMLALPELDIVRADLIAQTLYSENNQTNGLKSFDTITNPQMQDRISFAFGEKIETIRAWLQTYANGDAQPLDIFLSRLFGEVLSQKGFGLFCQFDASAKIAQLIYSIKAFRQFLTTIFAMDEVSAGIEFIRTVESGLLPSVFLTGQKNQNDAVLIAPAHSFLMENRSVACQFWLDIGSLGWWERLNQPLTNPYILKRNWEDKNSWSYNEDFTTNQENMQRIVDGLINRCHQKIYVYSVQVNERGSEQRGPLLQAFQTLRKRTLAASEARNV